MDLVSAGAAVIACLANIGPGLGSVGPVDNFAHIPAFGKTVLIVEQNVFHTLKISDRGYVIENGKIIMSDTGEALLKDPHVKKAYLGI